MHRNLNLNDRLDLLFLPENLRTLIYVSKNGHKGFMGIKELESYIIRVQKWKGENEISFIQHKMSFDFLFPG